MIYFLWFASAKNKLSNSGPLNTYQISCCLVAPLIEICRRISSSVNMEGEPGKDYWLISIPGEPTVKEAYDKLNKTTSVDYKLTTNCLFLIPNFKVGSLDQLVELSDEFVKEDAYIEGVLRNLTSTLEQALKGEKVKEEDNNLRIDKKSVDMYLKSFRWSDAKYNSAQSLTAIFNQIHEQVFQIEADMKRKWEEFSILTAKLTAMDKPQKNLLTKDLKTLVKKENIIQDSHCLTTVFVVVPRSRVKEWNLTYERLTKHVVPRTSEKIGEDLDFALFSVVILHGYNESTEKGEKNVPKEIKEFMMKALENKFTVRLLGNYDFSLEQENREKVELEAAHQKQRALLLRWLRINYSELFIAWVHLKALRLFDDSVLRYGLPVNFQAILMKPVSQKSSKKLKQVLSNLYAHLDGSPRSKDDKKVDRIPGLELPQEYHPYVGFKFSVNFSKDS